MNYLLSPVHVLNPGYGHLVRTLKTFSPTTVNEFIVGYNSVCRDFDFMDPSLVSRSKIGNPAQWYKDGATASDYIPDMIFNGDPGSPPTTVLSAAIPNHYVNKNWNFIQLSARIVF